MTHIVLENVTKIEGHARLEVKMGGKEVELALFEVIEGARYFESMLKGRHFSEPPAITSRICGICSQAHALSSLYAIENALKVKVSQQTEDLRNLMHLGSLIQSHVLHLYFLALPDYLGYGDAIKMASKYKAEVRRGLKLKQLGNKICTVLGGRQIHSVAMVVGGFSKLPTLVQLKELKQELIDAKDDALKTLKLFAKLKPTKFERKTNYLSLKVPKKFTLLKGEVVSGKNTHKQTNYKKYLKEQVVGKSTAKHVLYNGESCYVGALARLNNGRATLSNNAKKALKATGIKFPNYNPFMNNLAQAVEVVSFIDKCISIIDNLDLKEENLPEIKVKAAKGIAITEAPRGLLIHECSIDAQGRIKEYNIISPTTFNVRNIEEDIRMFLPLIEKKTPKQKVLELEKLIRAYDPCISCSAHFLEVDWIKESKDNKQPAKKKTAKKLKKKK